MNQLPFEIVQEIISYCDAPIRYKFYDQYKMYHKLKCVDQITKLRFVEYNCFNLLKHFGAPYDRWAMFYAAMNGNLEMIEFLYRSGSDWHNDAINIAASRGHLDVVQWLYHYTPDYRDIL